MENMDKNLNYLNEKQIEAVNKTEGSLLILAGAGSGKTRVLTHKIYYLLHKNLALPNQILAVTFTNKAANEMKSRVSKMINKPIEGWWIGTFHSVSAKILRRNSEYVNLKKDFVIIDQEDQLKLINKICEAKKIDKNEKSPKYFLNIIERYKNKFLNYSEITSRAKNLDDKNIASVYLEYEKELIRLNCCDFSNLILHCIDIFKKNKNILNQYQHQFKYILVDEYQDTNFSQQEWLKYLYSGHKNICCVGDDDQSIYSWRGAEIKNILSFKKVFENSSSINLEQNYRSTQRILNCASVLIKNNQGRYGKKLWSDNDYGEKIQINGYWETKEEAKEISDCIEKLNRKKISLNQIAILMRVAAHTRSFEERFLNIGLPYRIIGGTRFYDRKEIKDVISYLRIISNLSDNLALERIINVPKRGIGQKTLNTLNIISRKNSSSLFEACKFYLESNESNKAKNEINILISKILKWRKLKKELNHIDLTEMILEDSGYMNMLNIEKEQKDNFQNYDRLDNIAEFLNGLQEFENIDGFLEHVSLVFDNDKFDSTNKINLMTMHSAKGLEFDYVFLIGWEEGVFPSKRSIEENGKSGLEEERRLAYVALTRAKKNIFISYVNENRYSYASHDINTPSRFISELPKEDLEISNTEIFQQDNFLNEFSQIEDQSNEYLTPGKKRMLKHFTNNRNDDFEFNQDTENLTEKIFREGERIFHNKFGYGKIVNIEEQAALVNFEKAGNKMIFLKYLNKLV